MLNSGATLVAFYGRGKSLVVDSASPGAALPAKCIKSAARVGTLFLIAALAGCIGPVRDRDPALVEFSDKPMSEITTCLNENWVSLINSPVNATPIDRGVSYRMISNASVADLVLDLIDEGARRKATVYVRQAGIIHLTKMKRDHVDRIRGCL